MASEPKKITELIKENNFSYSFEITPDLNKDELCGIDVQPEFYSITWHAKNHQCKSMEIEPLNVATFLQSKNKQVLMHLSCDLLRKYYVDKLIDFFQEHGICNLFLMLGESYDPSLSDFQNTLELIKYIRTKSDDYFCIGVAGFCECTEEGLVQLKEKIQAGADFIITQAFFESEVYTAFFERCRNIAIQVPIIPGIFIFENYKELTRFTEMCKVKVSNSLMEYVQKNEGKIVGKEIILNMIKYIISVCSSTHIHFFTLNRLKKCNELIKQI